MERDQALKFMHDLLRLMLQKNGSDLFITANFPPAIKIDGKIVPQSNQQLTHTHTSELARVVMNDRQAAEFEATKECNFAISPAGIGRYQLVDFERLIRTGRRPDGSPIDSLMPWGILKYMTDTEIQALYAYLRTVPARPYGNR